MLRWILARLHSGPLGVLHTFHSFLDVGQAGLGQPYLLLIGCILLHG